MQVFFVGDFFSDTGPSIANKMLREGLKKNNTEHLFSDASGKILRIIELVQKIYKADCICFCGYSKINFIGIRIAKFFNKKTFYIMHGYKALEIKMDNQNMTARERKYIQEERVLFSQVDRIFCVSKQLMQYMKEHETDFSHKFDYNFNAVDLESLAAYTESPTINRKMNRVISVGGKKIKNILAVCKAIEYLNKRSNLNLEFVIIGEPLFQAEIICKYDFVVYYEKLPHKEVIKLMSESNIYIQNSIFETFGLSVIEAIVAGCNLLVSKNVGATGVLGEIESKDIIFDPNDISEISDKIELIIQNGNNKRLYSSIDTAQISDKNAAANLLSKINVFYRK